MGILRDFNKGSMDALRSLKNSDSGTKDSYIDKKEGFQYNQINARLTDAERFAKLLTDKPGLKFQGNQALIQQTDALDDLKKAAKKPGGGFNFKGLAKEIGKKALKTAVNNLADTASILAQIPVNGTGTHFIRGLAPSGYLQSGAPRETSLGQFLADQGIGGGINGAKSAKNGSPVGPVAGPLNADYVIDQPVSPNGLNDTSKNQFNGEIKFEENQFNSFLPPGAGTINQNQKNDYLEISGNPSNIVKGGNKITFLDNTGEEGWEGQSSKLKAPDQDRPAAAPPASNAFAQFLPDPPSNEPATEQEDSTKTYLKKLGSDDPLIGRQIVKSVQKAKETDPNRKAKIIFDNLNQRELSQFQISDEQDAALRDKRSVNSVDAFHKYKLRDGDNYTQSPLYIQARYSLGDQGSRTQSGPDLVNANSEQDNVENLRADLIPFYFNILGPLEAGSEQPENKFIQFRALLTDFTDNFSGNWQGTKYIGRAEEFYTYQGFNRDIGIGFKMAAFSRQELVPLYKKLNRLVGATAPTYQEDGFFMRGTLVQLKVGDYLDSVTGFITKVDLSWNVDYQWEIDADNLGTQKLPHILDVSVGFTPIHDFEAKTDINLEDEVYIGKKQLPVGEEPEPQPEPSGETFEFYSSKGTYTIDKATNKVVAVNGQPTNYVNGGFAYKANNQQAEITRVNGVDSEL